MLRLRCKSGTRCIFVYACHTGDGVGCRGIDDLLTQACGDEWAVLIGWFLAPSLSPSPPPASLTGIDGLSNSAQDATFSWVFFKPYGWASSNVNKDAACCSRPLEPLLQGAGNICVYTRFHPTPVGAGNSLLSAKFQHQSAGIRFDVFPFIKNEGVSWLYTTDFAKLWYWLLIFLAISLLILIIIWYYGWYESKNSWSWNVANNIPLGATALGFHWSFGFTKLHGSRTLCDILIGFHNHRLLP